MFLSPSPTSGEGRRLPRTVLVVLVVVVLSLVATACLPPLVDPPTSGRDFGQGPLEAVYDAATAKADCGLTASQLAAMMMAPTYSEAGGPVPSPMTLSRYDNVSVNATNANLFAFGKTTGPYVNAFFSPGIGMWQFDSAGGWPFSAVGAIDSVTAANQAATTITYRWCNAPTSQQVDAPTRRKYAWGPWFGCSTTSTCETVYSSLVVGNALDTVFDPTVTRYGGMQQRTCNVTGLGNGLTCWYVNPSLAQGSTGWTGGTYTGPTGVTPLPKPFYVVESGGSEFRFWLPDDTGYDIGITASKPITANARTSVQWSAFAALCDVTAARGACTGRIAQTPGGPRTADPFGSLDTVVAGSDRRITATGWAIDPDTNDPIAVHVYVDGTWAAAVTADQSRPDVGAAVPGYGNQHGYQAVVTGVTPGPHQVCTYAINVGPYGTTNPQLGCTTVTVPGDPFGNLEAVTAVPAGVRVVGWAIDPDTSAPVAVHVYVDGSWAAAASASGARGDVGAIYPWAGSGHGYDTVVPTTGGSHQICTYAINIGPTGTQNPNLGCATVVVDGSPLGTFDDAVATAGGVDVRGWAFDPDTSGASVQISVDGQATAILATTVARPDVGAAFPGRGDAHGFDSVVAAAAGTHQVCATVPNEGATGSARSLGCRSVTVLAGSPFGNVDAVTRVAGTARVTGWAIDPDVTGPVQIHVYVNGAWTALGNADGPRSDVGAIYPGYGPNHGIDITVAVPGTPTDVCVYAINVGSGQANPLLGCGRV